MIRWEKYSHRVRDYLTLMALLAISLIMISNNDSPQVAWMRSNVLNVFGIWGNWMRSLTEYGDLKSENQELRRQLARMAFENSLMQEAYLENDRLRSLLDFKDKSTFNLVPATIVVRNYTGYSHALLLDVGTSSGVAVNMPVLAAEGLVGRIVQVGSYNAIVQVLDDINFRVGAMIQRSRVPGVVQNASADRIILNYVSPTADVKLGDVVITSGNSTIYPKGIELGLVSEVDSPPTAMFKTVVITPFVDLQKLEEAFILTSGNLVDR